ncbi:MAG: hypothetical protein M1376_15490 [Planctomycetes bacterium]|nr:hypothetical protein [Planctomycetota bacterium]
MKRLLGCLLLLAGFLLGGCEGLEGRPDRDVSLSDGRPQVEVTVQQ